MSGGPQIGVVHVVVPARDEEAYLPHHLDSLRVAAGEVTALFAEIEVRVTVVLDSCTDGSARVLRHHGWVDATEISSGVVGEVRAIGVLRAAMRAGAVDPRSLWIACTDADTVVPPHWLVEQLALASRGYELVLGTVTPDTGDLPVEVFEAWEARHVLREGHTHVHGANMGFTLAAYLSVGGFDPVRTGEDVGLARRLQAADVRWHATTRTQVVTSGRRIGRVTDGFSTYLQALSRPGAPAVAGRRGPQR